MNLHEQIGQLREAPGMGIRADAPAPHDKFWFSDDPGMPWRAPAAGVHVTPVGALSVSVIQACVQLLADCLAVPPVPLYRRWTRGDGRDRATDDPRYDLIGETPNEYQSDYEFRAAMSYDFLLNGNAIAEKIPGARGATDQLWPISSSDLCVDWQNRKSSRRRVYDISSSHDGRARVLLDDQVMHLRLPFSLNRGLTAASPIALAREGVSLAMALQMHESRQFGTGVHPSLVVKTPATYDKSEDERMKKAVASEHAGSYKHFRTLVLWGGMDAKPWSVPNDKAQFAELQEQSDLVCCRIYGVPEWLVQAGSKTTAWGTGMETASTAFRVYRLTPLGRLWEATLNRSILRNDKRLFYEYMWEALLTADLEAKFKAFSVSLAGRAWSTPDEVRRMLNQNPIEGGDKLPTDPQPVKQRPTNGATGHVIPTNGHHPTGALYDEFGRELRLEAA